MRPAFRRGGAERPYLLAIEPEAVFLQRGVQTLHPGHFREPFPQGRVAVAMQLNPIAALFLGHVAGDIGGLQGFFKRDFGIHNLDHADADADGERSSGP